MEVDTFCQGAPETLSSISEKLVSMEDFFPTSTVFLYSSFISEKLVSMEVAEGPEL